MKTLIVTLTLLAAFSVKAQQLLHPSDIAQLFYSAHCDQICQGTVTVDVYKDSDLARIPTTIAVNLHQVAYNQAQIWGDTILESEYAADGNTLLDQVLVLKKDGLIVGYAISYSERAWFTGDCNYVHGKPDTLASCQEGRIKERSFTNIIFSEVEADQNQFAEFQAKD